MTTANKTLGKSHQRMSLNTWTYTSFPKCFNRVTDGPSISEIANPSMPGNELTVLASSLSNFSSHERKSASSWSPKTTSYMKLECKSDTLPIIGASNINNLPIILPIVINHIKF